MARAAERRLRYFNPQALANTIWAFATVSSGKIRFPVMLRFPVQVARVATVGLLDVRLFAVFARAAKRRIKEFNAQGLANTA